MGSASINQRNRWKEKKIQEKKHEQEILLAKESNYLNENLFCIHNRKSYSNSFLIQYYQTVLCLDLFVSFKSCCNCSVERAFMSSSYFSSFSDLLEELFLPAFLRLSTYLSTYLYFPWQPESRWERKFSEPLGKTYRLMSFVCCIFSAEHMLYFWTSWCVIIFWYGCSGCFKMLWSAR